jgi:uncharacterized protein
MSENARRIPGLIAGEINAKAEQVAAAIKLLDDGATVPFVARYRKEVTGGLDDTQLRTLSERLVYLRELDARRDAILDSIRGQGKLTDELAGKIAVVTTKAELEDIYLPYKPKRRTRAEIARERGLGPLAEAILANRAPVPAELAAAYVGGEIADVKAALEGARDIIAEGISENADLLGRLRAHMRDNAFLRSKGVEGKEEAGAKFSDYFDHRERWSTVAGHRALAMLRGRNEEFLSLDIEVDVEDTAKAKPVERMIAGAYNVASMQPGDVWLMEVIGWTWRVKLSLSLSLDLMRELRERAEEEAIKVFARNLKDLLLAAPAGSRPTMGLDPGIRTGVKVAIMDGTGKLLDTTTVYPFPPRNDVRGTQAELARLVGKHGVELIAIGNGTGSRETEKLVADMLSDMPAPKPQKVIVSEAGASVYSASQTAATEFPGLDVSLRGAVSIGRRLQDPLAELVKIEPKSIGVGQYQHDVDQGKRLPLAGCRGGRRGERGRRRSQHGVGTAAGPRLRGGKALSAEAIVSHIATRPGRFATRRKVLLEGCHGSGARVPSSSARASCAFRMARSRWTRPAVHPEAYGVAKQDRRRLRPRSCAR